jgi:hypothetical protein
MSRTPNPRISSCLEIRHQITGKDIAFKKQPDCSREENHLFPAVWYLSERQESDPTPVSEQSGAIFSST